MDGEVSPETVEQLLGDGDDEELKVVDIRPPAAYDRGHIPGSDNIPFGELPDRVGSLEGDERIVTVCPKGQASQQAARLIKSYEGTKNARVESMAGGLDEWTGDLSDDGAEAEAEGPDAPF